MYIVTKIYDFKALTSKGKEIDFSQFEGKVLLIVNTASKCGFTPQFAGLEELNQKYKDKGLVIIGFPCNQFKEQDPGTDGEIAEFCQINYGVTFQIMKKTDVNGANAEPIFEYLKEQAPTEEYNGLKAKAAKFDEMEEAGKSELQKAQDKVQALEAQIQSINKEKEISQIRTQVAQAKGVPADLLTGETQEACESQADKI